ncbi:hypothetical protein A3H09_01530 [Candidatus Falkowbacteria bacterium RIFCSPLOWO2_12_FULL_45_13]|uniref:Uncharacterized protein n=2 Tax=Candidatus Falkowiibacteriota TaxID=1752728 RepID=A0A1F5SCC0_9BACT|nr:MAG: hypothetical protein A3H66_01095 [Candidatus Falkowbacteria bacterium RIFCSPLOWO2_02_FULL_45_21]OGF32168.1 MAG: hypothetical protein A3H09_01530 [Candidatus Falkowbacteria bacterium RIFCSPLOWO2_12_FULL_45_13]
MTIPLIVFFYLYLLFIVVWLIFSIIALYHIIRYGQINYISIMAVIIYLAGVAVIFSLSFVFLSQIDWTASLAILQGKVGVFGPDY